MATSGVKRKNGCWSGKDISRVRSVLKHPLFGRYDTVYAIGTSSGGAFAAARYSRHSSRGFSHGDELE